MLAPPTVVGPLTPWTRLVRVQGHQRGTTVTVLVGNQEVGKLPNATGGDDFVPLAPGRDLQPNELVWARQRTAGGETSGATADVSKTPVLNTPTPELLAEVFSAAPLVECGSCLWLEGVVPGADVTVTRDGLPPVTVTAHWTAVHVDVPKIGAGEVVRVTQGRGAVVPAGPTALPPALEMASGVPVPPPQVVEPLYQCDTVIELTSLLSGAVVEIDHQGVVDTFCFGSTRGRVRLAAPLALSDGVRVLQRLPQCELESDEARAEVIEAAPPRPWFPFPVCAGDRDVAVEGVREGATVQFLFDHGTGNHVDATAGPPPHRFNLPPIGNHTHIGVRQSLCPFGPWSETTWVELVAVGANDQPSIVTPVHRCAAAVCVKGLTKGTRVFVVSKKWGGRIGNATATGETYTDVRLDFGLVAGDELSLQLVRCGQLRAVAAAVRVEPPPGVDLLPAPVIVVPADDAGGTIAVSELVPGAWCDIEVVSPVNEAEGVVVATQPATRAVSSIALPPLPAGTPLRARQRLCRMGSRPSTIEKLDNADPAYLSKSAIRICQLTGNVGNAGRPAKFDSAQVGLIGTDLGIPVEHQGRLYLFFGDCANPDDEEDVMETDADPIAWTTDWPDPSWIAPDPASGPRPRGPRLHWLTGSGGLFHRLHVDGLAKLANFEVPTGAFSHNGRLYVFVATYKDPDKAPDERMNDSHLAVTKRPANNPNETLDLVYHVSSTRQAGWPAGRWLTHVSPTVVTHADWPRLPPAATGTGVVMFGTGLYHRSKVFLAYCQLDNVISVPQVQGPPLGDDMAVPHPSTWLYFVDGAPAGPAGPADWRTAAALTAAGEEPTAVIPGLDGQGEVSVTWHPGVRRWLCANLGPEGRIELRSARAPWGPWSKPVTVFDPNKNEASADNLEPGHQFVGLPNEAPPPPLTNLYAPYVIPAWTELDRTTRTITLHYTVSTTHPPYNVQLMRATVHLGALTP